MTRHLLFRLIIAQLLFFGAPCLHATSASSASPASKENIIDAFVDAARNGRLTEAAMNRFIYEDGININAKNSGGMTALYAAMQGPVGQIKLLLKWGADPNAPAFGNAPPLISAAIAGRMDVINLLLAAGANPSTKMQIGGRAADAEQIARKTGQQHIAEIIADAKKRGQVKKPAPKSIAACHFDYLILHDAGQGTLTKQSLEDYIQHGGSVNATDAKNGYTALMIASGEGYPNDVGLLLKHGAAVNKQSDKGITALMLAAALGLDKVVTLLLEHGADISLKAENGGTALKVAQEHGNEEVVRLLLAAEKQKFENLPEIPPTEKGKLPTPSELWNSVLGPMQLMIKDATALILKKNLRAQDFHDVEKLLGQVAKEINALHELPAKETLKESIINLKNTIKNVKDDFIKNQESKVLDILKKNPTPTLVKAANKAVTELEELQTSELEPKIEELHKLIETWSKRPTSVASELTEAEKKTLQEQEKRKAQELVQRLDQALTNNNLETAEQLLQDIKRTTITDVNLQKHVAGLQDQYKKKKAEVLQTEYNEALITYKEKPTTTREQKVRSIIKELEDLKIPTLREFISKAHEQLKAKGKESETTEEKKKAQPAEAQQFLFIFDPFNQIEPLPEEIKSRAEEALKELSHGHKDPSAVKLSYGEGLWRIRVGNYRIIYEMLREKDAIAVVMIDARRDIYEDEQVQRAREDYLTDINHYPPEKLLSDAEDFLKKNNIDDAAHAEALLGLYRWQLRGYPTNTEDYLRSLLLSATAAMKMNDLPKARQLFSDLIPQARREQIATSLGEHNIIPDLSRVITEYASPQTSNHKIQQHARVGLAQVELRSGNRQAAIDELERAIAAAANDKERKGLAAQLEKIRLPSPTSPSPMPMIPQEDVVGKLRAKYQEARQLLGTNPEKATLALEQFSKESQPYAKELAQERRGADTLLNNEPIFASAKQALEEGEYDDAITFFNTYLKEAGKFIPTLRRQLIDEEIAQSELGRAIRREVEKRLVK